MSLPSLFARSATLVLLILPLLPVTRAAEAPPTLPPVVALEEQRTAMARLSYMAGNWVGSGWLETGNGRSSFHGAERVQTKLEGLALLVEGNFLAKDAKTGQDVPAHATLAVISFDPASKTYRFKSWLATGSSGERELKLTADGWQWEITHPRGTIRYTTSFPAGEWLEIGERSVDARSWQKFFEMRLRRAQ